MKLLFLGSGGSMGIPVIGCKCFVCLSSSPRNARLRPSVLIAKKEERYLIDIGPDYRAQALTHAIDRLDGLLLTHTHYDHIAGLDELRAHIFAQKKALPCLLSRETLQELQVHYHYFVPPEVAGENRKKNLHFQVLEDGFGSTTFGTLPITYVSYDQLGMKVTGFCVGRCAYITDIFRFDEKIFDYLQGIETLIMSSRGWEQSRAHLSLENAMQFARKTGANKTYFTHISHEIDHESTSAKLPEGFFLAYDGLELTI